MLKRYFLALLVASLCSPGTASAEEDIEPRIERRGDVVVIDVEAAVEASAATVWAVLTDYERMTSFITSLSSSRIVARQGNVLDVAQAGQTRVMFMTFAFSAVRRVELLPDKLEIRSTLVSGDFKSYVSITRVVETASGARIVHHGEYEPRHWIPPLIGPSVIAKETRRQYREMLAEMVKRKAAASR